MALQHLQQVPNLMAYMFQMAKNARKFTWPSWVIYDQNFRQDKAAHQDWDWSKPDAGMFTQCFIHAVDANQDSWCKFCLSLEYSSSSCPSAPPQAKPPRFDGRSTLQCRDYNTKKGCYRKECWYKHSCRNCQGPHPDYKCPSRGSNGTSSVKD